MVNFPASLDSLTTLTSSTKMNDAGYEGDTLINTLNRIAEALEAKVGTGASTATAGNVLRSGGTGASAWGKVQTGDINYASVPAARAYNTGAIALTNGAWTSLTFDSERYDTDAMHSTSSNTGRLTATTAGKYRVAGNVSIATGAGTARGLRIRVDGATIIGEVFATPVSGNPTILQVSADYDMVSSQWFELQVFVDVGSLTADVVGNCSPEFWTSRIG